MSMTSRLATAMAVAAVGLGLGATNASAYRIDGISGNPFVYSGTAGAAHTYTTGEFFQLECPTKDTTFTGIADGAAMTVFTPSYGGEEACSFLGYPATVEQTGTWELTVNAGPNGTAEYNGDITIPAGTSTTVTVPILGCSWTVSGPQTFAHGVNGNNLRADDYGGGVFLEAAVYGISYVAAGCPFLSGNDGQYRTNGVVTIPGIAIS